MDVQFNKIGVAGNTFSSTVSGVSAEFIPRSDGESCRVGNLRPEWLEEDLHGGIVEYTTMPDCYDCKDIWSEVVKLDETDDGVILFQFNKSYYLINRWGRLLGLSARRRPFVMREDAWCKTSRKELRSNGVRFMFKIHQLQAFLRDNTVLKHGEVYNHKVIMPDTWGLAISGVSGVTEIVSHKLNSQHSSFIHKNRVFGLEISAFDVDEIKSLGITSKVDVIDYNAKKYGYCTEWRVSNDGYIKRLHKTIYRADGTSRSWVELGYSGDLVRAVPYMISKHNLPVRGYD